MHPCHQQAMDDLRQGSRLFILFKLFPVVKLAICYAGTYHDCLCLHSHDNTTITIISSQSTSMGTVSVAFLLASLFLTKNNSKHI